MHVLILTLLATLACAGAAVAKPLVTYDRSGGFRATPYTLTIGKAGKARAIEGVGGKPETRTLSKKNLRTVKRQLKAADFSSLDKQYWPDPPGSVADGFTQRVDYRSFSVTVMTGAKPPAALERLLATLDRLATQ